MFRRRLAFLTAIVSIAALILPQTVVIGQAKTERLHGNEPLAAEHGRKIGHKSVFDSISFTVSLQSSKTAQLDAFLADLYNPSSPNYHQYLTPEQFGRQFGATDDQVRQVTDYLKGLGLTVSSVNPERTLVQVAGSVDIVEKAFDTSINTYQNDRREVYFANDTAPSIPSSLVGSINGIHGLDNEPHWKREETYRKSFTPDNSKPGTPPRAGSGPSGGFTPSELQSAYDVTPLNSAGNTGSNQTVAIFELDGFVQSNISTYNNYYNLGSPTPTTVLVDGASGAAGAGQGEVELDIEIVNAIAPKANVIVYEGPNTDQGVIDTYQKIASDNKAKAVSVSWGLSELQSSTSTMNALHTIFQQFAAQGQSVFAAAGDSGAYDGGGSTLAVDSPANDPYVTGVGGTHLVLNSSGGISSETVWSNTSTKTGGGGGISTIYAKPSWQAGTGTTNSYSTGKRQVPDVSADADPATGYSIYSAGTWTVYGGTSCAAPLWAGLAAVNNQYALANGKTILGYANPTLYAAFNTTQPYAAYHDITSGNNLYYPATTGYDQATGIGTPDAYNLIRDITGSSGTGTGGTPTELISNGGFESGSAPWVESSSGGYELVDTTKAHSGSYSAFLGGYNYANDTIYEQLTIPSTITTATLTYYTYVTTSETTHSYDYLYVQVRDTGNSVLKSLQTLSDANAGTSWVKQSFDLSAYKGKTVRIYFKATNDSSNPTDFFVDDCSLTVQ
jgi:kumamolisin